MMEHLINAPYFQVTIGAIMSLGVLILGVAMVTFKYFMPRLGKALLSPIPLPGGEATPRPPLIVNPEFCTACKAEHERSVDNKDKISVLFARTEDMGKSLGELCVDMATVKTGNEAILKAITRLENGK